MPWLPGSIAFAPSVHVQSWSTSVSSFRRKASAKLLMKTDRSKPTSWNSPLDEATKISLSNKSTDPTPILVRAWSDWSRSAFAATKMTAASAALATALLASTSMNLLPADAAMSGGRMGGSFSSPSRSSGGGSYGRSSGSYSRSYGSSSYYYSTPRRSTTIIAPIAPIVPFYSPPILPFYGGGAGVGVISYNRGPSFFDLLFLGGVGWIVVSAISNSMKNQWSDDAVSDVATTSVLGPGVSVIRLSVAMDVPNRDDPNSLLLTLDRIAATAQTGTRKGVQTLTSQVAMELLRRKSSIQSAASSYKYTKDERVAQRQFNQWSVEERSKFERENISKFAGIDTSSGKRRSLSADEIKNEKATMAVVTLVLSIQGDSTKLPTKIQSASDVENALRKIAADAKVDDCLIGAEILWTPEDRNEVLTRKDVVADYPELTVV
jgi:uncharacterized membrane protein